MFAGSSAGASPLYREAAVRLADELVARGVGLVYGGASIGLMGVLADRVLEVGGEVLGVIPESLVAKEVAHERLSELRVVGSMHERKAEMARLAAGFIALPGGLGTIEETFEILTWAQLGLHEKPCALMNTAGYYTPLLDFLGSCVREGFVHPHHVDMIKVGEDPGELIESFDSYRPPTVAKWLGWSET